ncbi:unnamed protein product [Bursaphelenchus xylophilus]|uniref:(pine wood nematode) hypothetical protein n=1 Tax=Bursaphelenchus xylophilus TaxID=6326 RepID=A0A1I7RTH4_BURXY|nr:unnamed protein product [Bursaphelenchus xylophilus]CAG9122449.1 unnamed protein product [Bursaphelenchus xylophilus]
MRMLILPLIVNAALADFVFRYKGAQGMLKPPWISISIGNNPEKFNVALDLNRPYSFAFDPVCQEKYKCDNRNHLYAYDPKKTGGKPTGRRLDDFKFAYPNYTGKFYQDVLNIGHVKLPAEVGDVTDGLYVATFNWDGVLGLGFDESNSSIVVPLLNALSVKQVVIQEGVNILSRHNRPFPLNSNGTFTFGKYTEDWCGQFSFYDTWNNKHWELRADVKVGNETLKNQRIAFVPGYLTLIPSTIIQKYFSKDKYDSDKDFPDISFSLKGKEYKITREDYSYSSSDNKYRVLLSSWPFGNVYDFAFGSEFLQHYCVALRADDSFGRLQIGLADNKAFY